MTTTENLPPIPEDEGIQDLLQLNRLLEITADSPVQLRDRYVDTQTDPGIMVADFMGNAEAVGGVKHRIAEETLLLRENLVTRNVTGAKADAIIRSGLACYAASTLPTGQASHSTIPARFYRNGWRRRTRADRWLA